MFNFYFFKNKKRANERKLLGRTGQEAIVKEPRQTTGKMKVCLIFLKKKTILIFLFFFSKGWSTLLCSC